MCVIQAEVKAKLDLAQPKQDSPTAIKQRELRAQLSSIRQTQASFKNSRSTQQDKINALDATLKGRIAEQKSERNRIPYKSGEELDHKIDALRSDLDSGTMKIVDERNAFEEIRKLRKFRNRFTELEQGQAQIDALKSQITALKKDLDNPEARALSDKYSAIQSELDAIKAEQDSSYQKLNSLRDERTKIHGEQRAAFDAVNAIRNEHRAAWKAYKEYRQEADRAKNERIKAEREARARETKKRIADQKLEEASHPAFADEIVVAENLIRHYNPTFDFAAIGSGPQKSEAPGGLAASVGRKVEDTGIQGMKVLKKEDDELFAGTSGKKGKKGKKAPASASSSSAAPASLNLNAALIGEFSRINVNPPMMQNEVPVVIDQLAEKIKDWRKRQNEQTEEVRIAGTDISNPSFR